jgi:hypothetical protein
MNIKNYFIQSIDSVRKEFFIEKLFKQILRITYEIEFVREMGTESN